jgi:hypothetical protein
VPAAGTAAVASLDAGGIDIALRARRPRGFGGAVVPRSHPIGGRSNSEPSIRPSPRPPQAGVIPTPRLSRSFARSLLSRRQLWQDSITCPTVKTSNRPTADQERGKR